MPSVQFQSLVSMMQSRPLGKVATLDQIRSRFEQMTPLLGPPPESVSISSSRVADIPAERFEPRGSPADRVMLYFHGGGYCIGSLNTHRTFCGLLAMAANVQVLSVAYRLAPEHAFPAAVDDAVATYRALTAEGYAPEKIVIGGDSAGGGLALASLVALRDAGDPLPAACVCLSPWTDLAMTGASVDSVAASDPMLSPWQLDTFARRYLNGAEARNPLASPLYANFTGFPPLLIHVGGAEILRDDSIRLAERARSAGVDVTLYLAPDMIHVWHFYAPILPEGRDALTKVGQFVRSRFEV
ncbi:MAG: alpha/beta hydrolase [Candidatus Hydrogenedentes bacterium]|nr:alpha/beta hydrolase [Candidatus Hydrogenedentota bacterium]